MIPVQQSPVVGLQEWLGALSLEPIDDALDLADGPGNELLYSQQRQVAVALLVVKADEVVDADGGVAVVHIETAACEKWRKFIDRLHTNYQMITMSITN